MPNNNDLSQLDGVGAKTEEKLREEGYYSVKSVARASAGNLSERTGIGESRCDKMINHAREIIKGGSNFQTGKKAKEEHNKIKKITTGSDALDDLLYGGIPTGSITEVFGKNSSGKSQLALQLSVNVQLPEEEGGLGREVLFIDTEDTFVPAIDRFQRMAKEQGLDPEEALDNVTYAKAFDSGHQLNISEQTHNLCADKDIGLIVVDSLMGHFRSDYEGRSELGARQSAIGRHLKQLRQLADEHNLAVFVTNQVMSDPGQQFGDPTKAIGGNVVSHNCMYIIYLKGKKNHYAQLVDSPNLPQTECEFDITEEGIRDV